MRASQYLLSVAVFLVQQIIQKSPQTTDDPKAHILYRKNFLILLLGD